MSFFSTPNPTAAPAPSGDGGISPGMALLLQSMMQLGGGVASGVAAGKASDKDRKAALEAQLRQNVQNAQMQGANAMQAMTMDRNQNQLSRDKMGLDATQMDPLAQQKSRAHFSLEGDKVRGWSPTNFSFDPESGMGGFSGGYNALTPSQATKQMYSPQAMANAEYQDFRIPLAQVNPDIPMVDLSQVGLPNSKAYNVAKLFQKGALQQQDADARTEKDAVQRAFQNIADGNQSQLTSAEAAPPPSGGSSIWKKLAKVGLIAGGGIATAMTGGLASPALAAAIGAGTGATSGALDGGWKGALMGGALGGATAGFGGGGAASGVKAGLGQAAKSTLTNPKTLLQMAGAGTGGAAGAAMQLASRFAPSNQHFSNNPGGSSMFDTPMPNVPITQIPPQGPGPFGASYPGMQGNQSANAWRYRF